MSWEAIGAIGEIVGAAAVVATLGYLALQMRQNTTQLKSATSWNINQGLAQIHALHSTDAEFTEIWLRGLEDIDALNDVEYERFRAHCMDVFNLALYAYNVDKNQRVHHGHADVVAILGGTYNGYPGFRSIIDAASDDLARITRESELLKVIRKMEPARFASRGRRK